MSETQLLNKRYQLEERLGSGGMAVVYRALDLMLERSVAIKVLREHLSSDPDFRERFRQEARAAANLSHPNIVTVHDFGFDSDRLFIVMEYVPGTHLKNIMQRRGRLTEAEAVSLMIQACAGVGYAHRAGLIHCDIKPHNLLVTPDKRVKVTDFGIARALTTISPDEYTEVVWGSPQYFSPEQASGFAPSPASDVYSLGIILYEMLTGQLPFTASSATQLAELHRDAPPIPPSQYFPNINPALEQILLKVLAKEPTHRYRTADQFGRVLVSFIHPSDPADTNHTPPDAPGEDLAAPRPEAQPSHTPPVIAQYRPNHNPATGDTQPIAPVGGEIDENPFDIDWLTIGLGLLAILAAGGLIPFYIYVYFLFF